MDAMDKVTIIFIIVMNMLIMFFTFGAAYTNTTIEPTKNTQCVCSCNQKQ